MTAVAASAWLPTDASNREWTHLSTAAPQLVVTMRRYLVQLTTVPISHARHDDVHAMPGRWYWPLRISMSGRYMRNSPWIRRGFSALRGIVG